MLCRVPVACRCGVPVPARLLGLELGHHQSLHVSHFSLSPADCTMCMTACRARISGVLVALTDSHLSHLIVLWCRFELIRIALPFQVLCSDGGGAAGTARREPHLAQHPKSGPSCLSVCLSTCLSVAFLRRSLAFVGCLLACVAHADLVARVFVCDRLPLMRPVPLARCLLALFP